MDYSSLFYVFLHSADYILELVVAILFLTTSRLQSDRGRLFMGMFLLLSVTASVANISYVLYSSTSEGNELLSMVSSVCSFPVFFMLTLYLVECQHPNEYDLKKIFKVLTPWLVVAVPTVMVCLIGGETHIYNAEDYMENISNPDVILRTLSLLVYLPYGLWCFLMPMNTNADVMTRPLTSLMCWCAALMTITFVGGHGLFSTFFDVMHVSLYLAITLMSVYSEFADRLTPDLKTVVLAENTVEEEKIEESQLTSRLRVLLEEEKLWKDPDLVQSDVARALGTNVKYLQNSIRELGYGSYSDMINSCRINYVKQQLDENSSENLKIIFYEAGFRSRITAWRSFSKFLGCSPTEYKNKPAN